MTTSALGYIYTALQAALTSSSTAVRFGRRESGKQINQGVGTCNRVIIDPSDSGTAGKIAPAKHPQRNPKPSGALVASATIYVWAVDVDDPNNELLQYEAVSAFFGRVHGAIVKALHAKNVTSRALHGWYEMTDVEWVGDVLERVRGAEWSFVLNVQEDILDEAVGSASNVVGEFESTLTGADGA